MKQVEITLTNEQITKIKEINATSRYDALEEVAKILNTKTMQKATWASSRKVIFVDQTTWAEITYSKGKVKAVEFYSTLEGVTMMTVKIA